MKNKKDFSSKLLQSDGLMSFFVVILGFLCGTILVALVGRNPLNMYKAILQSLTGYNIDRGLVLPQQSAQCARQRTHGHEEEHQHSHQPIAGRAEAVHNGTQHVFHQSAAIQTFKHTADHQQKGNDCNKRAAAGASQHQKGRKQPFIKGN